MARLPRSGLDQAGYLSNRTIAALASGMGGAIALVRASGPDCREILQKLTGRSFEPRKATLSPLFGEGGARLDEALVVSFKGPESFTGEDSFELSLHGGEIVVQKVLDRLKELGAGPALPGEFSFRAVRNGKMSVLQAQAVADLISAQSDRAHELALEKLSGGQKERVARLGEALRQLMALGELGIDFSDQEVDELALGKLKEGAREIHEELRRLLATFERGRRIQQGIPAAILGLPNAGKSSLFNALLGEERSIVSGIAGTTRDVVRETLSVRGKEGVVLLRLSDTAGLRDAKDEVEIEGIERSRNAARQSDVVVWVIEVLAGSRDLETLREWAKPLRQARAQAAHVVVVTKCDLLDTKQIPLAVEEFAREVHAMGTVLTSAHSLQGIEEVSELLARAGSSWVSRQPGEWILTSEIQRQAVEESLGHLERALEAPEYEFFAADIRQVVQALSPLIGETPTDEILGRIFSQFCIGK
jgi:tRNA modification GTPase